MEATEGAWDKNLLLVLLVVGSIGLMASSLYITKTLAISYGIGVGGAIESLTYNTPVASLIEQDALSLGALHDGLVESYVAFVIAIILFGASLVMLVRRRANAQDIISLRIYGLMHGAFTVVYVLLVFVILSDFYGTIAGFQSLYMALPYAAIAICLACDAMIQYSIRFGPQPTKMKYSIGVDPSTPFSNVTNLQDELFSKLSGHIKIVDKHFNTGALENFNRLMGSSLTNFTKVTVLTSSRMLDSAFSSSITDFKKELSSAGVGLDVRVMDEKDEVEQHERMLMDDKVAYKIPPFNIINKRSEHLTRIGLNEAQRRFQQLYSRSLTTENYFMKKAHESDQTK